MSDREFKVNVLDYNDDDSWLSSLEEYRTTERGAYERYSYLNINMLGGFTKDHINLVVTEVMNFRDLLNKDFERVHIIKLNKLLKRTDALHVISLREGSSCMTMYNFNSYTVDEVEPFFYFACLEDIMTNKSPIIHMNYRDPHGLFDKFISPDVDDHDYNYCYDDRTFIDRVSGVFNYDYHLIDPCKVNI